MTTAVSTVTPCPSGFSDHIFKVAHGVEVPLRLWPAIGDKKGKRPWLLWIHGGGFTSGKHVIPNAWVIPAFRQVDYHIVSTAYRFLPHVQLPGMVQDIQDAHSWCRKHLPTIVGADHIDIDACVVAGDSAGGCLSSLAGFYLSPRPRVVIDVFGVVDMTHPYFTTIRKETHDMPHLQDLEPRDRADQEAYLASRDESLAEVICPWDWEMEPNMSEAELQSFWGMPDFKVLPKHRYRQDLIKYQERTASRPPALMQREKYDTEEAYMQDVKAKWSVYHMLDKTEQYPPTFLLHGTADFAVPVEQSYRFEEKLREKGVRVGSAYCQGGGHCFENKIEGPEHEGWKEYIVPCLNFVEAHVEG